MKKPVKKLKICWPALFAMALTVSVISCHNEEMAEKQQQEMYQSNFVSIEDAFEKSSFLLQHPELEEVIIPDELESESTTEAGFSR